MNESILIVSAGLDSHTYGPVRSIIEKNDYDVITYLTDDVINERQKLLIEVDSSGSLHLEYGGKSIHPDSIVAGWYRKLGNYKQEVAEVDLAKQLYVNAEIGYAHDTLWGIYPDNVWLNSPDNIKKADRKFGQLILAEELGFSIPHTVLTNDWDEVLSTFMPDEEDVAIVKTIRGVISEGNTPKAMYTTLINQSKVTQISDSVNPFPGLYQHYLKKAKEWRVTVVGDNVFPVSILSSDDAKDDWRKHQLTEDVVFRLDHFPDEMSQRCIEYLVRMGLSYGAFDFIQSDDEEIIFLECNPNGQYMWLERDLGLPISQAIANELITIATGHR